MRDSCGDEPVTCFRHSAPLRSRLGGKLPHRAGRRGHPVKEWRPALIHMRVFASRVDFPQLDGHDAADETTGGKPMPTALIQKLKADRLRRSRAAPACFTRSEGKRSDRDSPRGWPDNIQKTNPRSRKS